jgi:hypothetical protein
MKVQEARADSLALGFEEALSVVISGEEMSNYMGIDGTEAEHVTLELLEWH